jgi:hypothetical protein
LTHLPAESAIRSDFNLLENLGLPRHFIR